MFSSLPAGFTKGLLPGDRAELRDVNGRLGIPALGFRRHRRLPALVLEGWAKDEPPSVSDFLQFTNEDRCEIG